MYFTLHVRGFIQSTLAYRPLQVSRRDHQRKRECTLFLSKLSDYATIPVNLRSSPIL